MLILAYSCALTAQDVAGLRELCEHVTVRFVGWEELDALTLPVGYRTAIESASG